MDSTQFWKAVDEILERDPSYHREAYPFVMESLEYTLNSLGVRRHVSARELLDGLCSYARERYGLMASTVLSSWGIETTEDVGRIVFNLVEAGVLSKRDEDREEDFKNVYDLKKVLEENYFS